MEPFEDGFGLPALGSDAEALRARAARIAAAQQQPQDADSKFVFHQNMNYIPGAPTNCSGRWSR